MFWGSGLSRDETLNCPINLIPGRNQLGKLWEQIRTEYIQCGIPSEFQSIKDVTAKPKRILRPRRN